MIPAIIKVPKTHWIYIQYKNRSLPRRNKHKKICAVCETTGCEATMSQMVGELLRCVCGLVPHFECSACPLQNLDSLFKVQESMKLLSVYSLSEAWLIDWFSQLWQVTESLNHAIPSKNSVSVCSWSVLLLFLLCWFLFFIFVNFVVWVWFFCFVRYLPWHIRLAQQVVIKDQQTMS